ncbi:MAG: ABC transporter ATP-binding protein [Anaerolineae bacterium]|nr:ABC transporter ATP-binding protein [Anaerolineae bacterium]
MLKLQSISKSFGGLHVLQDVNIEVPQGTIFGLIGPNGAGKTTMFNVVNAVYPSDTGRVIFRGDDITAGPPNRVARLGLARTHQVVRPLNDLTVRENVMVGACFGREHKRLKDAAAVANEVLARVGLADRANQLAGSLNVAQKKRLELARALAARPYLLLLDEVLAGLNPSEVSLMVDLIKRIRDEGITILMIEHLMHAVMNVSDRVLVLDFGKLIATGTPDEVVNNPQVIEAYLGDPKLAASLMGSDEDETAPPPAEGV